MSKTWRWRVLAIALIIVGAAATLLAGDIFSSWLPREFRSALRRAPGLRAPCYLYSASGLSGEAPECGLITHDFAPWGTSPTERLVEGANHCRMQRFLREAVHPETRRAPQSRRVIEPEVRAEVGCPPYLSEVPRIKPLPHPSPHSTRRGDAARAVRRRLHVPGVACVKGGGNGRRRWSAGRIQRYRPGHGAHMPTNHDGPAALAQSERRPQR